MRTKGQLFLSWGWGKQGEDRLLTLQRSRNSGVRSGLREAVSHPRSLPLMRFLAKKF